MKRILSKRLSTLAFLLGLMTFGFGVTGLSAQDSELAKWVIADEAITRLNQEISVMDLELKNTPNEALDYKRKYYSLIVFSIEEGQAVPQAVEQNYVRFVPATTSFSSQEMGDMPNPLSVAVWQGYRQEATQLLKN
jgi:hypothetical protein